MILMTIHGNVIHSAPIWSPIKFDSFYRQHWHQILAVLQRKNCSQLMELQRQRQKAISRPLSCFKMPLNYPRLHLWKECIRLALPLKWYSARERLPPLSAEDIYRSLWVRWWNFPCNKPLHVPPWKPLALSRLEQL